MNAFLNPMYQRNNMSNIKIKTRFKSLKIVKGFTLLTLEEFNNSKYRKYLALKKKTEIKGYLRKKWNDFQFLAELSKRSELSNFLQVMQLRTAPKINKITNNLFPQI